MNKICWKGRAFKALSYGKNPKKGGRNFSGSITIFHRGGGSKKLLRRIDFQRKNVAKGLIERIEYDPNRTARIALVRWSIIEFNGDDLDNAKREADHSTLKTPIGNRTVRADEGTICASSSQPDGSFVGLPRGYNEKLKPCGLFSYSQFEQSVLYKDQSGNVGPLGRGSSAVDQQGPKDAPDERVPSRTSATLCVLGPKETKGTPKGRLQARQGVRWEARRGRAKPVCDFTSGTLTPHGVRSRGSVAVYEKKAFSYILACDNLKSGDEIFNIEPFGTNHAVGSVGGPATHEPRQLLRHSSISNPRNNMIGAVAQLYQKRGNSLLLANVPLGSLIHNIEINPGGGGKLARSAGTSAQLVQKSLSSLSPLRTSGSRMPLRDSREGHRTLPLDPLPLPGFLPLPGSRGGRVGGPEGRARSEERLRYPGETNGGHGAPSVGVPSTDNAPSGVQRTAIAASQWHAPALDREATAIGTSWCYIRLPSGSVRILDSNCRATIGIVSNTEHGARNLTKAGQSRWLGRRPVVRGVAMNPIDHPHGGGEGRTKGGRPSVSPWGKPAKGGTTRRALATRNASRLRQ